MSFLQPLMLVAIPLVLLPIIIHLINQWRYQTKQWAAMMFLLTANRMNRGYARLRQWLILAMRALAIAGLVFIISRPLASGFLGFSGGSQLDTTIVLLDRSPSMQQRGGTQQSKLDTGLRQIAQALRTLGSTQWVLIDSNGVQPETFRTLDALIDSPNLRGSSASADIPKMLQSVVEYLDSNKPGPTDIWICSDLRSSDWTPESSNWATVRDALKRFPQAVKIRLLAYTEEPTDNLAITVTESKRQRYEEGESVLLSFRISQTNPREGSPSTRTIPVQIELDGARSELSVEMTGRDVEVREHRLAITKKADAHGRVTIPADLNAADNESFFVASEQLNRRVVIVSDDRDASKPIEIAASISPNGQADAQVDILSPEQLDSLILDGSCLLIWQASLPNDSLAGAMTEYVARGGQILFFPPAELKNGRQPAEQAFMGIKWKGWASIAEPTPKVNALAPSIDQSGQTVQRVLIENWRSDQDLLAATRSGAGLPVGQLNVSSYAKLEGTSSHLATFSGGDPLLTRVPTEKGAVYFCTISTETDTSSFAENGVVLYAVVQRAIEKGQLALGSATMRTAGTVEEDSGHWRRLLASDAITEGGISSEYAWQAGVYEDQRNRFAVNRAPREDQSELVDEKRLDQLFEGLDFTRVNDRAGSLAGIVQEVWQWFCVMMIVALIVEAALCLPRKTPSVSPTLTQTRAM